MEQTYSTISVYELLRQMWVKLGRKTVKKLSRCDKDPAENGKTATRPWNTLPQLVQG